MSGNDDRNYYKKIKSSNHNDGNRNDNYHNDKQ